MDFVDARCRIGLVTVTYNSSSVLDDFLASVRNSSGVDFHLYVIDNASADDSVAKVRAAIDIPITVIANVTNDGVATGNNQGIEAALADGCDWVFLVNNDTLFAPDLMSSLVIEAERTNAKMMTPTIEAVDPDGSIWYAGGRFSRVHGLLTKHELEGRSLAKARSDTRLTGYAPSCALMVHSSVFDRVGRMDERFFVYFDDADFVWRARRAGYGVWIAGHLHLLHKASALTGGSASDFSVKWMSRNWILMVRKHTRGAFRAYCLTYIATWTLARQLLRLDTPAHSRLRWHNYRESLKIPLSRAALVQGEV